MTLDGERPLLMATDAPATRSLAAALDTDLLTLPALSAPAAFERWRDEALGEPARSGLVICVWLDGPSRAPLIDLETDVFEARFEAPLRLWSLTLGVAACSCLDGGSIVGLVQAPAALDSAGFTPETRIADGVVALARSVAAAEGERKVRANVVTKPIGLVSEARVAPAPPLPGFPGRLEGKVAGAIRLLISDDAAGLTGRRLSADGGRPLA